MKAIFGGLPRAYWFLVVGMFVNRVGGFVIPFLSLYLLEHEGLTTGQTGFVLACWGTGTVVSGAIGGQLADKWGRKPTMLLGLCGGAAALFALAVTHDVHGIATLAFLLGSVAELYRPAVSATISDLVPPADRARAFGHLMWAFNLGFAVSPLVAGSLAHRAGYGWLFFGDAATMVLAAALIAVRVPETRPHIEPHARIPLAAAVRTMLGDRRFRLLLLAVFMIGLIVIQVAASIAHIMSADGIDAEGYGQVIALNGMLIVLTQPWAVPQFEKLGRYRVIPWAALIFAAGFALHALAHTPLAHRGAIVCWTLGEVALFPLCNAAVADLAPEHLRGRYQGTYWMAWASANIAGPPLGLYALDHAGARGWSLGILGAGSAAATALAVLGGRMRKHVDVAAPTAPPTT